MCFDPLYNLSRPKWPVYNFNWPTLKYRSWEPTLLSFMFRTTCNMIIFIPIMNERIFGSEAIVFSWVWDEPVLEANNCFPVLLLEGASPCGANLGPESLECMTTLPCLHWPSISTRAIIEGRNNKWSGSISLIEAILGF